MHISWRLFRFTQKWISHSVIRTMCLIESTKSSRIPRKIVSKGFPEQFWCRVHSTTLLPCPHSLPHVRHLSDLSDLIECELIEIDHVTIWCWVLGICSHYISMWDLGMHWTRNKQNHEFEISTIGCVTILMLRSPHLFHPFLQKPLFWESGGMPGSQASFLR